ncbi:DUF1877 family protein [Streptomyces sediminimaris]|uniref:DUF1877 family protein n=1 Tax=Streptomyces sediminimaris TaxID=3383721 RepID=UPI00399BE74F
MSMYFHLRAVPPPALRNSANWLRRLFEDDWTTVRDRIDRHREEFLDRHHPDHDFLYAGATPHRGGDGPRSDVVLGGSPVAHPDPGHPPFLLLPAARTAQVAAFLTAADIAELWHRARAELLPRYGGTPAEDQARTLFESAHHDLTAFYARTAEHGDAVVKCVLR